MDHNTSECNATTEQKNDKSVRLCVFHCVCVCARVCVDARVRTPKKASNLKNPNDYALIVTNFVGFESGVNDKLMF